MYPQLEVSTEDPKRILSQRLLYIKIMGMYHAFYEKRALLGKWDSEVKNGDV